MRAMLRRIYRGAISMDKIKYYLFSAVKNLWLNSIMTLASVAVLCVCLLLMGTSALMSVNINNIVKKIEQQNQIMVVLDDPLSDTAIYAIGEEINDLPNVKQSTFVSKSQALNEQKKSLGKYGDLLNSYDQDNPLPNTYTVMLNNMQNYENTVKSLQKIPGVQSVQQNESVANQLNKFSHVIGIIGIWLFIILAAVSLIIISNTIKLALYVRKREINIMKFVGATDWFIRWPFLMEGFLIGLIAGVVSFFLQWYIYSRILMGYLKTLPFLPLTGFRMMAGNVFLWFILAGVAVGTLGSLVSVRKYMKV